MDTYTLGLWRSVDDVMAFVRGGAHRAAVRAQREDGFEYSQFAGVWAAYSIGTRTLRCDNCNTSITAPAPACTNCGNPLDNTFLRDPTPPGQPASRPAGRDPANSR